MKTIMELATVLADLRVMAARGQCVTSDEVVDAHTALEAAIAQKEAHQEPCGYVYSVATNPGEKSAALSVDIPNGTPLYTTPPNTLAVLKQALEALDNTRYVSRYTHIVDAIAAIRGALGETS